jgi:hypothetical protein
LHRIRDEFYFERHFFFLRLALGFGVGVGVGVGFGSNWSSILRVLTLVPPDPFVFFFFVGIDAPLWVTA